MKNPILDQAIKVMLGVVMLGMSGYSLAKKSTVLVLHSYHEEYQWVAATNQGIHSQLDKSKYDFSYYYLDARRIKDKKKIASRVKEAKKLIDEKKPNFVIAVDDHVQKLIVKGYAGQEATPQFVFCGVNGKPEDYGFPAKNVTGVLERPKFVDSIRSLKDSNAIKTAKKPISVAVISDKSHTSLVAMESVKESAQALSDIKISYYDFAKYSEWQKKLKQLTKEVDAVAFLLYHSLKDAKGKIVASEDAIAWAIKTLDKPSVGFWDFAIEKGVLLGVVEAAEEHGAAAGAIVAGLAAGKEVSAYPIKPLDQGYLMINVETAEQLDVEIPFDLIKKATRIIEPKKVTK